MTVENLTLFNMFGWYRFDGRHFRETLEIDSYWTVLPCAPVSAAHLCDFCVRTDLIAAA